MILYESFVAGYVYRKCQAKGRARKEAKLREEELKTRQEPAQNKLSPPLE